MAPQKKNREPIVIKSKKGTHVITFRKARFPKRGEMEELNDENQVPDSQTEDSVAPGTPSATSSQSQKNLLESGIKQKAFAMQQIRLERIQKRDQLLSGLHDMKSEINQMVPQKPAKKPWTKRIYPSEPTRKSRRIDEDIMKMVDAKAAVAALKAQKRERRTGSLKAKNIYLNQDDGFEDALSHLQEAIGDSDSLPTIDLTVNQWNRKKNGILSDLKKLRALPGKLKMGFGPDKGVDACFHPDAVDPMIIASCTRKGQIGISCIKPDEWSEDGLPDCYNFRAHTDKVTCLKFGPEANSARLLSSSLDGTLRSFDLNTGVLDGLFANEDQTSGGCYSFAFRSETDIIGVLDNGTVVFLDTRVASSEAMTFFMGSKTHFRTVDVNPVNDSNFVTATMEGDVCLWDVRHHRTTRSPLPLLEFPQVKGNATALFSPLTGTKILTTNGDQSFSVFDVSEGNLAKKKNFAPLMSRKSANIQAPLAAKWHPLSEDLILCRSLKSFRVLDVWDTTSAKKPVATIGEGDLTSHCFITAIHPRAKAVVGMSHSSHATIWM